VDIRQRERGSNRKMNKLNNKELYNSHSLPYIRRVNK
jgi:hypothetical protein